MRRYSSPPVPWPRPGIGTSARMRHSGLASHLPAAELDTWRKFLESDATYVAAPHASLPIVVFLLFLLVVFLAGLLLRARRLVDLAALL